MGEGFYQLSIGFYLLDLLLRVVFEVYYSLEPLVIVDLDFAVDSMALVGC